MLGFNLFILAKNWEELYDSMALWAKNNNNNHSNNNNDTNSSNNNSNNNDNRNNNNDNARDQRSRFQFWAGL